MTSSEIKPFQIDVPEEKLSLLKRKLDLAEFPDGKERLQSTRH